MKKAALYMATYNKNNLLSNTLYSIARQKISFPFEVCIVDDCSDIDPEPIIRKFIPDAKYKRFKKRQGFDVVTTYVLDLVSNDTDILIMQSADVIHYGLDTIERLCSNVGKKEICMASVRNTNPPENMYKNFDTILPTILNQWKKGKLRTGRSHHYFFLGAIRRKDYESLKCITKPHCDILLSNEIVACNFQVKRPSGIIGFHQAHSTTTVPCTQLSNCKVPSCALRKRCGKLGLNKLKDCEKT